MTPIKNSGKEINHKITDITARGAQAILRTRKKSRWIESFTSSGEIQE